MSAYYLPPGQHFDTETHSNNQHRRRLGSRTEDRSDLEYQQGGQESPFQAEEPEHLPKGQLERTLGEQVGRPVPSHILQGVELVCDARDGGGNDGAVQGDAEEGDEEGEQSDPKGEASRIRGRRGRGGMDGRDSLGFGLVVVQYGGALMAGLVVCLCTRLGHDRSVMMDEEGIRGGDGRLAYGRVTRAGWEEEAITFMALIKMTSGQSKPRLT